MSEIKKLKLERAVAAYEWAQDYSNKQKHRRLNELNEKIESLLIQTNSDSSLPPEFPRLKRGGTIY